MRVTRPELHELGLNTGKKARLHRILFQHGLRNGTALLLPYDQGLEQGPRAFRANPPAGDPAYVARLAVKGEFNAIVVQIGVAEKFYWDYAGEIPLILKLNRQSTLHASVSDAVRLGADAVGYTLLLGTGTGEFEEYRRVRDEARYYGMPLVVWAQVNEQAIAAENGRGPFYATGYAARVASELGADLVAVCLPYPGESSDVQLVVRSVSRTLVLVSGGELAGDEAMFAKAREAMDAGATGLSFGRNVWQRPYDESLRFVDELKAILAKYPSA